MFHPIIRIDDFPTGVRPIVPHLDQFVDILKEFDRIGEPFVLGIVPRLLLEIPKPIIKSLKSLKYMVPAQHGYDHAYFRYSKILIDKKDFYNERNTVQLFDEFEGLPQEEIRDRLLAGRQICQKHLGVAPVYYIPPCNVGGQFHALAVDELKFKAYYSFLPMPGGVTPFLKCSFYGHLSEMTARSLGISTFHITWEWDYARKYGFTSWKQMFEKKMLPIKEST